MRLDATDLRYISSDEFRVLTAVEIGSKNHEVVPTPLIAQISSLRNGGVNKLIGSLAKRNLVSKVQNSKYDGYRLTYGGYDYLAMRALSKRGSMHSVGNQIGVGKESDIYVVADSEGNEMVLKLHRLGRISFRAVKEKRDYLGKRKSASWMYMSRLAAQKECAFMKVLHEHGFPVPRPIDQARHCILMEYIDAYPLRQISELPSPGKLYSKLMDVIVRFAHAGLIHGDFNEFNILIQRESGEPIVIDFPQMVSTSHENAEWYFNRDVECIRTFFRRRFQYESVLYPRLSKVLKEDLPEKECRLDVMVAASGFGNKEMKELEHYMNTGQGDDYQDDGEDEESSESSESGVEEKKEEQLEEIDNYRESSDGAISTDAHRGTKELHQSGANAEDGDGLDNAITSTDSAGHPDASNPTVTRCQARSRSPDVSEKVGALTLSDIRNKVTSDLSKDRSHQQRKYHSKRGARQMGRPQGSKAKQDQKIKLDGGGMWD